MIKHFPSNAELNLSDKCNWSKFDGKLWVELLHEHPQLADKCQWGKLNGAVWGELLNTQPQLAENCDWDKLDGAIWTSLLSTHPEFAEYRKQLLEIKRYFILQSKKNNHINIRTLVR